VFLYSEKKTANEHQDDKVDECIYSQSLVNQIPRTLCQIELKKLILHHKLGPKLMRTYWVLFHYPKMLILNICRIRPCVVLYHTLLNKHCWQSDSVITITLAATATVGVVAAAVRLRNPWACSCLFVHFYLFDQHSYCQSLFLGYREGSNIS
jgi:hypothetical protein